jgi:hypothetical protein
MEMALDIWEVDGGATMRNHDRHKLCSFEIP